MSLRKFFVNFLAELSMKQTSKVLEMLHSLTIYLLLSVPQSFAKMFAGENFMIA